MLELTIFSESSIPKCVLACFWEGGGGGGGKRGTLSGFSQKESKEGRGEGKGRGSGEGKDVVIQKRGRIGPTE